MDTPQSSLYELKITSRDGRTVTQFEPGKPIKVEPKHYISVDWLPSVEYKFDAEKEKVAIPIICVIPYRKWTYTTVF